MDAKQENRLMAVLELKIDRFTPRPGLGPILAFPLRPGLGPTLASPPLGLAWELRTTD